MKNPELISRLKNKKVAVLGLGISNLPLIDLLLSVGADITVRDANEGIVNTEKAVSLAKKGVKFVVGENYLENIESDFIFRSPGIRPDHKSIADAVAHGAVLTSEMALFLNTTESEVFAITGSDGKTTTTTLTHLFLEREKSRTNLGRAYVGGNIGAPLLPYVSEMTKEDVSVLELSSFQLMDLKFSPLRAAITNITPNHLNWHTGMEEYTVAKKNVFDDHCTLVLNAENEITSGIARERVTDLILFSSVRQGYSEIVPQGIKNSKAIFLKDGYITVADQESEDKVLKISDILLPGIHNLENYMTAIALTHGYVDKSIYTEVARTFPGVEHRLEFVRELRGVRFYNSSIDSSPTRTAAALSALEGGKVVICGGYDKNIPFDTLATALLKSARSVVLTGATAEKIHTAILESPEYKEDLINIIFEPDFKEAVFKAQSEAKCGESVLLSPACASFDAFKNFEERGRFFKTIVNELV